MRSVLNLFFASLALVLVSGAPAAAQERFSFDTTPGLLSKDVRPSHYALRTSTL